MGSVVGLDIGTTGVRAVETSTSGRTVTVKRAHAVALPHGTFSEGKVRDKAALVAALRQLWRGGRFNTRKAAIVVGTHPAVLVRGAVVDWVPSKSDLDAIVHAQAGNVLPTAVDHMHVDYHVADVYDIEGEDGKTLTKASVAVVGIDKVSLNSILDCVWAAGVHPVSVDVTAFALARFIAQASSGPGLIDVVINLGATTVTMAAIVDKQFVAELPLNAYGGDNLTTEIVLNSGLSNEEAEKLKLLDHSQGDRLSGFDPRDIEEAKNSVNQWATALVRSIRANISETVHTHGMPVGRVWLAGGEARLPNLAARLSAELGGSSRVAVLDPTAWVSRPEKLQQAAEKTKQDLTSAVAASVR